MGTVFQCSNRSRINSPAVHINTHINTLAKISADADGSMVYALFAATLPAVRDTRLCKIRRVGNGI